MAEKNESAAAAGLEQLSPSASQPAGCRESRKKTICARRSAKMIHLCGAALGFNGGETEFNFICHYRCAPKTDAEINDLCGLISAAHQQCC